MGVGDFLDTPRNNSVPSIMTFPTVDIEGIKRKLNLKKRAAEQGAHNLPVTDADILDPVELDIVAEVNRTGREHIDQYRANQGTYQDRVLDFDIKGRLLTITSKVASAVSDLDSATHVGTGLLFPRKQDMLDTGAELANFRKRHGLERPPRNYRHQSWKRAVLALIILLESLFNMVFLARGNEFGLLGGFMQAFTISGVNVAIGCAFGVLVTRQMAHRSVGRRTAAWMALPIYLALAFGINLVVAHYRVLMSTDPFEAGVRAINETWAQPFAIADFESWMLFIVGLMFSLGAAFDGWCMDDPYPGYGQCQRDYLAALNEYNSLKEDLQSDLEEVKASADGALEDLVRSITSRRGDVVHITKKSQSLHAAMLEYLNELDLAGNTLLSFYYNENRKHRKDPPPARFNQAVNYTYPRPTIETASVTEDDGKRMEQALAEAMEEIPRQQEKLSSAFLKALDEYKRIDDLLTPARHVNENAA